MKYLATLLVLAAAVSVASAAPILTWDKTVVGSYDVYTMGVEGDQGAAGWYLDAIFTASNGQFNQELVNSSVQVDELSGANSWDGMMGYAKATDTWYYDDHFCVCAPGGTEFDIQATDVIKIRSLGSIAGDLFESNPMIQFVVDSGTTIGWVGVLSYAGANTDVEGSIPEPATLTLLALGGLALIRRKK